MFCSQGAVLNLNFHPRLRPTLSPPSSPFHVSASDFFLAKPAKILPYPTLGYSNSAAFFPIIDNPGLVQTAKHPSNKNFSFRCFSAALSAELKTTLDKVVSSHKVVVFMKGTKEFPQCGFSNTVVQILKSLNIPFESINILENEILRQGLKEYSSWPTFPQLYVDGEFFGGCDITVEAYQSGELQERLEKAICS